MECLEGVFFWESLKRGKRYRFVLRNRTVQGEIVEIMSDKILIENSPEGETVIKRSDFVRSYKV